MGTHDQVYQLGAIQMTVRSLDARALENLPEGFGVLLPAVDGTRLPKTLDVVLPLVRAGCADVILAGPRAEVYRDQVSLAIQQQGGVMVTTAYEEMSDACNAALLGALIHKAGVALIADEPELLDSFRGVAEANGWTAQPAATQLAEQPAVPAKPQPAAKQPAPRPARQTAPQPVKMQPAKPQPAKPQPAKPQPAKPQPAKKKTAKPPAKQQPAKQKKKTKKR